MKTSLILAVLLSGCASIPNPEIIHVPVTTPCKVNLPEKPDLSAYRASPEDSTARKAAKLIARELALKEYVIKLETEAGVCK